MEGLLAYLRCRPPLMRAGSAAHQHQRQIIARMRLLLEMPEPYRMVM